MKIFTKDTGRFSFVSVLIWLVQTQVHAQTASFTKLNDTLQNIITALQDAGIAVVTIAIIWSGYKMIFQHARWADVSTVVIGAVFIGGAASIAKWLIV